MTIYGYARVSTDGQTLDVQIDQLQAAGATKVFREKQSGAKTDRAELAKLIRTMKEGDILLVTKLDRLARSLRDIVNVLHTITQEKNAHFKVTTNPAMDTTSIYGKALIGMLGSFAELERDLIIQRTGEGRIKAKSNGVKFGRKHKLTPHQKTQALELRAEGKSQKEIGQLLNVSHQTIGRLERSTIFKLISLD
jgi:DNA invertase Pin-like site-specific DNA recombinase